MFTHSEFMDEGIASFVHKTAGTTLLAFRYHLDDYLEGIKQINLIEEIAPGKYKKCKPLFRDYF